MVTARAWAKHGDRIPIAAVRLLCGDPAQRGIRPGAMGCSVIRYPSPHPTEKLLKTTFSANFGAGIDSGPVRHVQDARIRVRRGPCILCRTRQPDVVRMRLTSHISMLSFQTCIARSLTL